MERSLYEPHRILAELIAPAPLYVVSPTAVWPMDDIERKFCRTLSPNSIAFTSPVNDLNFRRQSLRYQWRGRGCCIAFNQSPDLMTETEAMGVLLHEVGHWVNAFDRPERDEPDEGRAIKMWWEGIDDVANWHGLRWFKACVNLWHRVTWCFDCGLPFTSFYDPALHWNGTRPEMLSLLDEASRREDEPIEAILKSTLEPVARPSVGPSVEPGFVRRESIRERHRRFGLPRRFAGWIDGQSFDVFCGAAFLDGEQIPLEAASRLFARYRSGEADGRAPRQYADDDPRLDMLAPQLKERLAAKGGRVA